MSAEDASDVIEDLEINADDSNETIRKCDKIKLKGKNIHIYRRKQHSRMFGLRKG